MIKKKLNILLLPLLVVLFISLLGTISYAYEVTYSDCEQIAYSIYNASDKTTDLINKMWTAVDNIQTSTQSLNAGIDTVIISVQKESYYIVSIYGINSSKVTEVSNPGNINYMSVTTDRNSRIYYSISSYANATNWTSTRNQSATSSISFGSGSQLRTDYLFISKTLGNDLFTGPWQNKTILDFDDDYFTFLLNSNLNTITINGDSVPYIEHNTNQATTYILGELGLAEYFYNAELFTYRWQQGSWKLVNIRTLDNIGPTSDNLIEVTIRGDWINPNTLYSLQMNPDPDSDFAPYSQPFFVKNRYTSITNGILDLDNTFSGDYYNNYNNDTNTQDVINNTNDDSQVTAILGDFFNSGDSGDSMLSSLGFDFIKRIDNPFVATIRTIFLGLLNCFLDNSDVVLDLGHHGTHMYISSADFSTSGSGDVFILVKYALEGLWIFFFCKAGYTILTHATTADINGLLNDVDVDGTWHNPMDRGDWRLM